VKYGGNAVIKVDGKEQLRVPSKIGSSVLNMKEKVVVNLGLTAGQNLVEEYIGTGVKEVMNHVNFEDVLLICILASLVGFLLSLIHQFIRTPGRVTTLFHEVFSGNLLYWEKHCDIRGVLKRVDYIY